MCRGMYPCVVCVHVLHSQRSEGVCTCILYWDFVKSRVGLVCWVCWRAYTQRERERASWVRDGELILEKEIYICVGNWKKNKRLKGNQF